MAEFSTTKITPSDGVQIPSISGQVAGYQENDELKAYVLGTIPTDVSDHTADIAGIRGTTDGYQESGKAYAIGDPCIQDNIVYVAKEAIADPAGTFDPTKWDQSDLVTLMLKAKENSDAITSLIAIQPVESSLITISAGSTGSWEVDVSKTGYTAIGIVGFWISSGAITILEWYINNNQNAHVFASSSDTLTNAKVRPYILYVKNFS